MDGWVDGWVGVWMDGRKSRFKDCLQQSKNFLGDWGNNANWLIGDKHTAPWVNFNNHNTYIFYPLGSFS